VTFRDVLLAIEGLRERDLMHQHLLRRSTFIIASAGMGGQKIASKMHKLWPMEEENKSAVSDRVRKTLRHFQELDAIKKVQDARRS
jgi:hypothetical protein